MGGKMYTIKDILELRPCKEYTKEKLEELWEDKKTLSLREILKLDIDIDDKNWVVPQLVSTDTVVEWAQYCADTAKKHAVNATASARYAASAAAHAARYAAADTTADKSAAYYTNEAARSARYFANAARYAAADATAKSAARSAGYAADAAEYAGYAAGYASWSENRDAELYRLLTILCDIECCRVRFLVRNSVCVGQNQRERALPVVNGSL